MTRAAWMLGLLGAALALGCARERDEHAAGSSGESRDVVASPTPRPAEETASGADDPAQAREFGATGEASGMGGAGEAGAPDSTGGSGSAGSTSGKSTLPSAPPAAPARSQGADAPAQSGDASPTPRAPQGTSGAPAAQGGAPAGATTDADRLVRPSEVSVPPANPVTTQNYGRSDQPPAPAEPIQVRRNFQPELQRSLLE